MADPDLYSKDDHLSRWIQLVCGILFLAWVPIGLWLDSSDPHLQWTLENGLWATIVAAAYFGVRCLWYAVTGSNNINIKLKDS